MELLLLADPDPLAIARYLPRSVCFVVEKAGETVACAVLSIHGPTVAEIENVAVRPDRQGQGLGQALLKEVLDYCATNQLSEVRISTGNSSIGQLYLYQKLGFRITGIEPDYFVHTYPSPIWENGLRCTDRVLLVKRL